MNATSRRVLACLTAVLAAAGGSAPARAQQTRPARNLLANPGFEMGRQFWNLDKAGKTVARMDLGGEEAAEGTSSALVTIEEVDSWGVQFGQVLTAGAKGKTYTFAVLARGAGEPVQVALQIERNADPWDRVARTEPATLKSDQWTELHVTFKVQKDYNEPWFAYVACSRANSRFRVDLCRLYEGDYVPYQEFRRQEAGGAGVSAYDTVAASAEALSGEALARKASFLRLPEDKTDHAFGGDAVLLNNRLAVVLRKKGVGAEVYSIGRGGIVRRARLAPASASAVALDSIRLAQNSSSQAALEAVFKAADGRNVAMRFEVKMGQPFVGASGLQGAAGLRVQAPCRFAVLPDFFADDIVLDAERLGPARAELPGENFLLHLLEGGEAIVADVWAEAADDVVATLAGQDAQRRIESADIPFGKKAKAWVAVLEAPGIWHRFDVAKADAGKVVPLGWKAPFPAQWRLDWRRDNGLADSWEMLLQRPSGDFLKQGMFGSPQTIPPDRKRWTTVLGTFPYPCWIDRGGEGLVQPLQSPAVRFEGPAVLYPIGRANNTPLDACTVIDVLRSTLGVGPCEYVLDVEGQQQVSRGRATCSNRDTLDPIYQSGQQRQKRAEIERSLNETLLFIQHIRSRIEGYVQTGHEVRDYLAERKKARPDLAGPIGELEALAGLLDARVAARKDRIKTPRQAAAMMEEFRKDGLDDEGPHALEKCQKFTAAIVEIGGNQDELVGECRWAVKVLRQQAALTMAGEPRMADIAREVRLRTQKALRNPAGHEGAAH